MSKKCVVFDFDGTLVDVEEVMLRVYGELSRKKGWPELSKNDIARLRVGGARAAMDMLRIKFWQLPKVLKMGREEYQKHSSEIYVFPEIKDVVLALSKDNDIYVLSSNNEKTVEKILKANDLTTALTILKGSSLFGKDKSLKRLIRKYGYDHERSWMIGDEARDVEAGKKAGLKTIGVTWGLQGEKGLKPAEPDFIAKTPKDILKIIV